MPVQPENKIFPQVPVVPPKDDGDLFRWANDMSKGFQELSKDVFDKYNRHLDQTHAHPKSWRFMRVARPFFRSHTSDTSQVVVDASSSNPIYFLIGPDLIEITSSLIMDLDVAGPGGLRSGLSKAANTMYYLYAVKSGTTAALLSDTNDPATGPSGYSDWTYLGGFPTIAASAVPTFTSTNGVFLSESLVSVTVNNASPAVAKTLSIPTTAKLVYLRSNWAAVTAVGNDLLVGATSGAVNVRHQAVSTTLNANNLSFFWVHVLTSQTVYANVTTATTDSVTIIPFGWIEKPEDYK